MDLHGHDGAPEPLSLLTRPDRWLSAVENLFSLIAAGFIVFLMFFGVAQVVSRKIFNYPLWGYIDIVEITMATFVFLGIAYCQRMGGHVRMELLVRNLRGRVLWVFEAVGVLVAIAIMCILAWYAAEHFLRAYELGDSTIDREIILWPSKLLVPVAFSLLILRLMLQLAGYGRLVLRPDAEPVAVPMIEQVEEVAKHEMEHAIGEDGARPETGRDGP